MPDQPHEIWQEAEQSQSDAAPEPFRREVFASGRECHSGQNSDNVKHDCIFGHQTKTQHRSDGQPPTGIVRADQANEKPGCKHPPEKPKEVY